MNKVNTFNGIPIVLSGEKYKTPEGFSAIKNGIKKNKNIIDINSKKSKPSWLKAKLPGGKFYDKVKTIVDQNDLSTVCEESLCPNIGECWNHGTATIMIMGAVCTRACKFCAVDTGNPKGFLDPEEPKKSAIAVNLMQLEYVVITSVDRDDLIDGGANHYSKCIEEIKRYNPTTAIEALTPDFNAQLNDIKKVVNSGLDVFAQNIETVKRLTKKVRDPRAGYGKTLTVLRYAKELKTDILTKSSLMLGLGETKNEVLSTLRDLRDNQVDIVTLGQYLAPSIHHLPIEKYVSPGDFNFYREEGLKMGFVEVVSGPLVRSSYRADKVFNKNNVGMSLSAV